MELIYFGNGQFYPDSTNLDKIIQEINTNTNNKDKIVIYGGNYKNNTQNNPNNIDEFLNSINKLSESQKNLIMFGNYDLDDSNIFGTEINFYRKNTKFEIFNDLTSFKLGTNTLVIMFDSNLLLMPNPNEILIVGTIYENLFGNFSKNINKDKNKKIQDLIDYQFDSVLDIIEKNHSVKNIVFITQNPLVQPQSQSEQEPQQSQNTDLIQFYEWVSDVGLKLNLFNLYWLCSNSSNFESGTINISSNSSNILNIKHFVVGNYLSNISKSIDFNLDYNKNINVKTKLTDKIQQLNIIYKINKASWNLGYLNLNLLGSGSVTNLDWDFIEINNSDSNKSIVSDDEDYNFDIDLIVEPKFKPESEPELKSESEPELKSKSNKYLKKYANIMKNVEISENSSNKISQNSQELTDSDNDPYKEKYLKYKAKLLKLRKIRKETKDKII